MISKDQDAPKALGRARETSWPIRSVAAGCVGLMAVAVALMTGGLRDPIGHAVSVAGALVASFAFTTVGLYALKRRRGALAGEDRPSRLRRRNNTVKGPWK